MIKVFGLPLNQIKFPKCSGEDCLRAIIALEAESNQNQFEVWRPSILMQIYINLLSCFEELASSPGAFGVL